MGEFKRITFDSFAPVLLLLLAGCVAVNSPANSTSGADSSTPPATDANAIIGQTWRLQEIQTANGDVMRPEADAVYTLLLVEEGSATGQADCNAINATYTFDDSALTFGPIASTKALCPPGSLFDAYVQALSTGSDYVVTDDMLTLAYGTGDAESGALIFSADGSVSDAETAIPDKLIGTWQWQAFEDSASGAESSAITVDDPALYVLNLLDDGTAQVTADCNVAQMDYRVDGNSLTFLPGPMTLAACGPDSLSNEFVMRLGEVASYVVDGEQLVLNLKVDAGNLIFATAAE